MAGEAEGGRLGVGQRHPKSNCCTSASQHVDVVLRGELGEPAKCKADGPGDNATVMEVSRIQFMAFRDYLQIFTTQ